MTDRSDEPTTDVKRDIIGLFAAINRRYAKESESAAAVHELTPLQAKALLATDPPVPMRRVAERLHAEPSNVTAIIDRLESRGLVERGVDPGDRRVKLVAATEAGRAVVADLHDRMPFTEDPLVRLTPAQREELRELLRLILEA